ncbi:DNA replication protein psf2 [Hypoxylon texense]
MSSDQSMLYSQGFSFGSYVQDGVDPRTGQYTCTVEIYKAPAKIRNCAPLRLSLLYDPLNPRDDGFGPGWSFNLSSYQHRQSKTLILSTGERFQAEEATNDIIVKDQKLKGFLLKKKDYGYQVIHKDGQVEVLSNASNTYDRSVPVQLYAPNGRLLNFSWTRFGEQPRLQSIQDGSSVLLDITYQESSITITRAPNTSESSTLTCSLTNNRLAEIQLPLEEKPAWNFAYQTFDKVTCLSRVTSPGGLVEEVTYSADGHLLPQGAPYNAIPTVASHVVWPGGTQLAIRTNYSYSDKNFLAYESGSDWKEDQDNLYQAKADYQYSTVAQIVGGAKTTYVYNKFHLLVSTRHEKGTKQINREIVFHASDDTTFDNQPAQYQLPKTIRTILRDTATPYSRTETTQHEFDEWGNPISKTEPNGIVINRLYYSVAGEQDPSTGETLCPADPYGFQQHVKRETVTPKESPYSAPTRTKSYKYRALSTATGAPTSSFVGIREIQNAEGDQTLSTTEYTYVDQKDSRDHGRFAQRITKLLGKYATTYKWTWSYPTTDQLKTVKTTSSFDNTVDQESTISSMSTGLVVSTTDKDGNEIGFQYDKIGRLTKETVSPGTAYEATKQNEFALGEGGIGHSVTTTDFQGAKTRQITDGLGRVFLVERQDDSDPLNPGSSSPGPFRTIHERRYDEAGQCIRADDVDWITRGIITTELRNQKKIEYDDWGQVYRVTDSSGIVSMSITDPIQQTHTEGIEGQSQTKTQFNDFGAAIKKSVIGKTGEEYSKIEYAYDGLGRLASEKDNFGRVTDYEIGTFDRVTQTIWPNDRTVSTAYADQSAASLPVSMKVNDSTAGTQSFDGLRRVTSQQSGSRTTTRSYQGNAPKAAIITTPKGDKHEFTYASEMSYALTRLQSPDDSDAYEYDKKTSALLGLNGSYVKEKRQYLPSGLLKQEDFEFDSKKNFSAQSAYSMAGRLLSYTDVHGQTRELTYDAFGRLINMIQGKTNVTLTYDNLGRLSESSVLDAERIQTLTTKHTYDEFGREITRIGSRGLETLYKVTQGYNAGNLLIDRIVEDGKGSVLRNEHFQYDGRYRLVSYDCSGAQQPVDDKGKAIQSQQFKFDVYDNLTQISTTFGDKTQDTATHQYSTEDPTQLVKITHTHPSYPPTVNLEYDKNGCLTRDEQGRQLKYDSRSRLKAVLDSAGKTLSEYSYDASGKLVCQKVQGTDTYLHYRGDKLVATATGDSKVSYISDGGEYWGQTLQKDGKTQTQLWASDSHQSVLSWFDTAKPTEVNHQTYTPYGFNAGSSAVGFNGQWRDPVTGWYHLGNGYRVYNPALMRFHSPDQWSPFASREPNAYAYCLGDPVNRVDPTGHLSLLGAEFGWRDLAMTLVGVGVGVVVGLLTGGAGFAIAAGMAVAAGVASDVATGAIYDAASGKAPTWESVGEDAAYGVLGGVVGEAGGRLLGKGIKAAVKGLGGGGGRGAIGRSGARAATAAVAAEAGSDAMGSLAYRVRSGTLLGAAQHHVDEVAYFDSLGGVLGHEGLLTHGHPGGNLLGLTARAGEVAMLSPESVVLGTVRPLMREAAAANPALEAAAAAAARAEGRPFHLIACYGATSGAGQRVADALGRPVVAFYGEVRPLRAGVQRYAVYNALETPGGFERIYGQLPSRRFDPLEAMDWQ